VVTKQYTYMNYFLIKKSLAFILMQVLFCSFLFSQDEWILENGKGGKCYYSFEKDSTNQEESDVYFSNTIIETIDPVFKNETITLTKDDIEKYRKDNDRIKIEVKPSYIKYVFKRVNLRSITQQRETNGYSLCIIEYPKEYKIFTFEEIEKGDFKYTYQAVKEPSHIKKIKVASALLELSENQFFISEGSWSIPKELIIETQCFIETVRIIQCRLNDLGYSLAPNNLMDEDTKAALIDFQIKNGLPTGRLDFDTLDKLELQELYYDN